MKIAILVDSLAVGGAERQAILCVAELRKLGHQVDLVYYNDRLEYSAMLRELEVTPVLVEASGFTERCKRLAAFLKNGRYDVVHGFKMAAEVYAAVAGKWAGVPHRFGCHRTVYSLGWKFRLLHFLLDKLLEGWIVNSQATAESMSRLVWISRSKIKVLYNGISPGQYVSSVSAEQARVNLGFEPNSVLITMIARLEPEKNHAMLLAVARRVLREIPDARFLVVGQGSLQAELQRQAAALKIADRVSFLGLRSDVAELLAATDISVHTSSAEAVPNAIIEAMSAGKPIVCTRYYGASEIMSHGRNALLAPCGDVDLFAYYLLCLIRDSGLRRTLGENARRYAESAFAPAEMARRLEAIYRQNMQRSVELQPAPVSATPS